MLKLELNEGNKQVKKVDLNRFVDNKDFRLTSENDFCEFVDFVLDLADFKDLEEKKYDKIRCIKNYREIKEKNLFYTNIEAVNLILKDINVLFLGGYYLSKTLLFGEKVDYCWDLVKAYRFESVYNSDEYYNINEIEDIESNYDLFIMENGSHHLAYNCNADSRFNAHNIWCDISDFNSTDFFDNDRFYDFYNSCEYCGDIYDAEDYDSDLQYIDDLGVICRDCAENRGYVRCQDTGEWVNAPFSRNCGDCCCCDCEDCPFYQGYEENEYNKTGDTRLEWLIDNRKDYGKTAPSGVYKNNDYIEFDTDLADFVRKNGVYFGIELETKIEDILNENSLEYVENQIQNKHFEAKYDCTICDDRDAEGFEFVSKKLYNIYDLDSLFRFKDFVKNLENAGFFADSDCGAHIHLDRMGTFTSEDFVKMAYKIEKSSINDIENLFGREFSSYCGRLGSSCWANAVSKAESGEKWDNVLEGLNYGSHGYFLNVSRSTVEFRLFAGTVSFYRIMRNISVLKVLKESVKDKSFEELKEGWNDNDYERLNEEMLKLREVGLINE